MRAISSFKEVKLHRKTADLSAILEDKETNKRVSYKTTTAYDDNGEILYEVTKIPYKANGSGFVISYTDKICELLAKITTGSILRVFMYIAHNQAYGNDGRQFGYRCSKKHLQEVLKIDRTTIWDALKYLKENFLVLETVIDGQSEFMVNPNYITIGSNKKQRVMEWNRRWEEYFKRTGGKL